MHAAITVKGVEGLEYKVKDVVEVQAGNVASTTLYVKIKPQLLEDSSTALTIYVQDIERPEVKATYSTTFFGPNKWYSVLRS